MAARLAEVAAARWAKVHAALADGVSRTGRRGFGCLPPTPASAQSSTSDSSVAGSGGPAFKI
jgi:hypothetical protein